MCVGKGMSNNMRDVGSLMHAHTRTHTHTHTHTFLITYHLCILVQNIADRG